MCLEGRHLSPTALTVGARVADGATGAARLTPQQLVVVSGQRPYIPGSTADRVKGRQGRLAAVTVLKWNRRDIVKSSF